MARPFASHTGRSPTVFNRTKGPRRGREINALPAKKLDIKCSLSFFFIYFLFFILFFFIFYFF